METPRSIFRSRRRRLRRQVRHRFPGELGGDGGGGVLAPSPSGGGGGGSASGPPPPSQPSSPSPMSAPAYSPAQPASYGTPDPQVPMSESLRGALDGTGPGYPENRGPVSQPTQQGPPQGPAPPQGASGLPDPQQWASIRQSMARFGVQLPDGITPEQGLAQLAQAFQGAQQRNYYADVGAAVAPHLDQFTAWQQEQQAAQQPAAEEGPWNPPQFDPQWMGVVEVDPNTGRLRSKAGYDPRYGTQAQAYADFIDGQQREFWQDPPGFIQRMVGSYVQQQVQQGIQGSFSQYQEQVQANRLIEQNRAWLYQADAQGRPVIGASGRPQLSPNGVRYYQYIEQAARTYRMQSVAEQNQYAMDMLERDALRQRHSQAAQAQAPPQGNFQQAPAGRPPVQIPAGGMHSGNVNGLQQMTPAYRQEVQPTVEVPEPGMSLSEMLRNGFQANGVTDEQIRRDMMFGGA